MLPAACYWPPADGRLLLTDDYWLPEDEASVVEEALGAAEQHDLLRVVRRVDETSPERGDVGDGISAHDRVLVVGAVSGRVAVRVLSGLRFALAVGVTCRRRPHGAGLPIAQRARGAGAPSALAPLTRARARHGHTARRLGPGRGTDLRVVGPSPLVSPVGAPPGLPLRTSPRASSRSRRWAGSWDGDRPRRQQRVRRGAPRGRGGIVVREDSWEGSMLKGMVGEGPQHASARKLRLGVSANEEAVGQCKNVLTSPFHDDMDMCNPRL